jgi:nitrogen fixation protein FixH
MTAHLQKNQLAPRVITGKHVLFTLLAFFALILATNTYLVTKAISTFGGIETTDAYRKGLTYNKRIAAAEKQSALGWTTALDVDRSGSIIFKPLSSEGKPVTALTVTGTLGRPATNQFDIPLTLSEETAGTYRANAGELENGAYIISLKAEWQSANGSPETYETRRRVWLSP